MWLITLSPWPEILIVVPMRSWRQLSSLSFHQTTTWPPGRYKMLTATLLKDNGCETSGMRWPTVIQQWLFQMVHLSSLADECIKDHKSMFIQFLSVSSFSKLVQLGNFMYCQATSCVYFCHLLWPPIAWPVIFKLKCLIPNWAERGIPWLFLHPPKNSGSVATLVLNVGIWWLWTPKKCCFFPYMTYIHPKSRKVRLIVFRPKKHTFFLHKIQNICNTPSKTMTSIGSPMPHNCCQFWPKNAIFVQWCSSKPCPILGAPPLSKVLLFYVNSTESYRISISIMIHYVSLSIKTYASDTYFLVSIYSCSCYG